MAEPTKKLAKIIKKMVNKTLDGIVAEENLLGKIKMSIDEINTGDCFRHHHRHRQLRLGPMIGEG